VWSGFDVIWDVLFEPFIRRLCFVWGRTIMYKCPVSIVRAKDLLEIRFCSLQKGKILGPREVIVVDEQARFPLRRDPTPNSHLGRVLLHLQRRNVLSSPRPDNVILFV
jgi:hypothetical protein